MYKPTIGLEIHAELKTKTKLFCNSKNDPDEVKPNKNICPVCMGYPGTLPVINKEAIRHMIRIGLAIGGTVARETHFDRKNYFYPDIPKGYQISQYKCPLVVGGSLAGIAIERVHLEEDTARSIHKGDRSLLDFNRAGVPLMELVTKPVIKNAKVAVLFAKELQLLLRTLRVGEANMEKGEMRVEANISVSPGAELGTKVEVKNLNSFRAVERAIAYEIKRQIGELNNKNKVIQETRGWDEVKGKTFSQRLKEEAQDYRYFPEPDLTPFQLGDLSEFGFEKSEEMLPELPWEKREKYQKIGKKTKSSEFKINPEYIEMFVADERYGGLFDETYKIAPGMYKLISSSIGTNIAGLVSKHGDGGLKNITPERLAEVNGMFMKDEISSSGRDDILAYMFTCGGDPQRIAEEKSLLQVSDEGALKKIVKKIIDENSKVVEDYKGGRTEVLQYLVGQGMKETKGSANPKMLQELFTKLLR